MRAGSATRAGATQCVTARVDAAFASEGACSCMRSRSLRSMQTAGLRKVGDGVPYIAIAFACTRPSRTLPSVCAYDTSHHVRLSAFTCVDSRAYIDRIPAARVQPGRFRRR
jgi:hypothetical protein